MEIVHDHYVVLGLKSGVESSKYTEKDIASAYRKKTLESHPDKHPNDRDAPARYQKLQNAYNILIDPTLRKQFDDSLKLRRAKMVKNKHYDPKRRTMMSDLEEKEKAAVRKREEDDERRIKRKFAEELAQFRKKPKATETTKRVKFDTNKMLKVRWVKVVSDYTSVELRELFEEFGEVEDVVFETRKTIKGKRNKSFGSALVLMRSKEDAADATTRVLIGRVSNPLLVTRVGDVADDQVLVGFQLSSIRRFSSSEA